MSQAIRENLNNYQGEDNVTKVTNPETGAESYLTQSLNFVDEAYIKGACKLNTVETEKKHVLFLFNSDNAEVGRYYLGKKLQGMTPAQIAEKKHSLVIFKSFNPNTGSWVPCVGLSTQEDLSVKAVSF